VRDPGDEFRCSSRQITELDFGVSQQAPSRRYPPLAEMVLKMGLSPTPATPIPLGSVARHFGRHGCEVAAFETVDVATMNSGDDVERAIDSFKDGTYVLGSQTIFVSKADEAGNTVPASEVWVCRGS